MYYIGDSRENRYSVTLLYIGGDRMSATLKVLDKDSGEEITMSSMQTLTASTKNLRDKPIYRFSGDYATATPITINIDFERMARERKRLRVYYRTILGRRAQHMIKGLLVSE